MGTLTRAEGVFPTWVLEDAETALVLFAGQGKQDLAHITLGGLAATCVDIRYGDTEDWMGDGVDLVRGDAFDFCRNTNDQWDVVTLDPHTGAFQDVADALALWCSVARHAVVMGVGEHTTYRIPKGWDVTGRMRRSWFRGGVHWLVLEREGS